MRITAIGDSTTVGLASAPVGPGWVEILQDRGLEIENLAVGGSDTLYWIDEAPNPDADLVTLMLGTVDGHRGLYSTAPDTYAEHLEVLLDDIDAQVLLLPPVPSELAPALIGEYQERALDVCAGREDASCGPRWEEVGLTAGAPWFESQEVHPNGAGYEKMADVIEDLIVPEPASALLVVLGLAWLGWRSTWTRARR